MKQLKNKDYNSSHYFPGFLNLICIFIFIVFSSCSGERFSRLVTYKKIILDPSQGTEEYYYEVESRFFLRAPDLNFSIDKNIFLVDHTQSVLYQYSIRGKLQDQIRLLRNNQPLDLGPLIASSSENIYVQNILEGRSSVHSASCFEILQFDLQGQFMRTITVSTGILKDIKCDDSGSLVLITQQTPYAWRVERYVKDRLFSSHYFSDNKAFLEPKMNARINNVILTKQGKEIMIEVEYQSAEKEKTRYRFTRYYAYDLVLPKGLRLLFSRNLENLSLVSVDNKDRFYFFQNYKNDLVRVIVMDKNGQIVSKRTWDLCYDSRNGYLLAPMITSYGQFFQVRLQSDGIELTEYR